MAKDISMAVREICLSFPKAEEVPSRGSPDFRVAGKTFATYVVNHHGDGHIALWLRSPPGAQELYSESEPAYYFVPPYVGPRGWLGVHLDQGLDWRSIAERVREAFAEVAPKSVTAELGPTIEIDPPTKTLDPEEFDPFAAPRAQDVLDELRGLCLALPETTEAKQFGRPSWRAGKKGFCTAHRYKNRMTLQFWVGADQQAMLTYDERYRIPAYIGHNGWIELDVEEEVDWREVENLVRSSYRHFALKRMLKVLDGEF